MKTRVCEICLKSGLLCRSCTDKVETGKVSRTEVRVAEALLKLSGEKKQLKDIEIAKVVETPSSIVIICGRGDAPKVIGASGQNAKKLERALGKRVMVAEEAGNISEFVRNLLSPLPVASVSTVYRNGHEVLKVTTGRGRGQRISSKDFSEIVRAVYGKNAELSGE